MGCVITKSGEQGGQENIDEIQALEEEIINDEKYKGVPPPKRMTLKELQKATNGFAKGNILGDGTLGQVFLGELVDPASEDGVKIQVVVKKLFKNFFPGYKAYLSEVLNLDRLRHPNLIRLVGYSHEKNEACLAYEYCERGSLSRALALGISSLVRLNWSQRISIASDIARGLAVMHHHRVIHRALKSSNILLTNDLQAKVTDFALARPGPADDEKHVSTRVLGDLGYLDPAYMASGRLTKKTDVYSFGVILLELITGLPSIKDGIALAQQFRPILESQNPNLAPYVDSYITEDYSKIGLQALTFIARHCLDPDPSQRPTMVEVLSSLDRVVR